MKKIIVGAGDDGRYYLRYFGKKDVLCFADTYKSGQVIDGKKVISLRELASYDGKYQVVICSQKYQEEIQAELQKLGIRHMDCVQNVLLEEILREYRPDRKHIFLLNTHDGVNVGDHLITIAELYFFRQYFQEYDLIEIPQSLCNKNLNELEKYVLADDLLIISGGGYLGDLWMDMGELNVRNIIKSFPNHRITIFPQTIFYQKSGSNLDEMRITKEVFDAHKDLTVCFRDISSYKLGEDLFQLHVHKLYTPDIAMLLDRSGEIYPRKGILVCMRDDREKNCGKEWMEQVGRAREKWAPYVHNMTMMLDRRVPPEMRMECIAEKLNLIQRARLVITDRLHCMIMCAISATPCIAIDNLTKKVSGAYDWIKNNQYLRIADERDSLSELIDELSSLAPGVYRNQDVRISFQNLANLLHQG